MGIGPKLRAVAWIVSAMVVLYVIAVLVKAWSLSSSGRIDQTQQADCIVVPGAGQGPAEGRIQHAIDLYKKGQAHYIIFTGGAEPNIGTKALKMAIAAKIPITAVVEESSRVHIFEDLAFVVDVMSSDGWKTCLISTEPFNMVKCLRLAKEMGLKAYPSPALDSPQYTSPLWRLFYTLSSAQIEVQDYVTLHI